jgi:solute carrier family 25 phosphate transporter 23/24/25/41
MGAATHTGHRARRRGGGGARAAAARAAAARPRRAHHAAAGVAQPVAARRCAGGPRECWRNRGRGRDSDSTVVMAAIQRDRQAEIEAVFRRHDTDGSGTIDTEELLPALAELGVDATNPATVHKMLEEVDSDQSGCLDLPEFSQIFASGRLRNVFDEIDHDSSGTINTGELQQALKKLGCTVRPSQVAEMLAGVDTNNDGTVDFTEFSEFFKMVPFASLDSIAQQWTQVSAAPSASDLAPPIPPPDMPAWLFLAAGGTGGCVSRTATAPLERVKLAAQIRGSSVRIVSELTTAYAQGGLRGLFAGNAANCVRVFPYGGIVTASYINLLKLTPADGEFDRMEPIYRGSCAATAGVIGQATTYPLDVVRARLTLGDGASKVGIWGTLKAIQREEGVRGLYRGLLPTCMATAPFLFIQLPTLDVIKMVATQYEVPITTGLLVCGGATAGGSLTAPLHFCAIRKALGER